MTTCSERASVSIGLADAEGGPWPNLGPARCQMTDN